VGFGRGEAARNLIGKPSSYSEEANSPAKARQQKHG
jgi:hypothetical protein